MASNQTCRNLIEGLRTSCNNMVSRIMRLPYNILEEISRFIGGEATARSNPSYLDPQENIDIIPEEWYFLNVFEQKYGESHPFFYPKRLMEVLKIAKKESKFVFVYLHAPDHPLTSLFCRETLCSELAAQFLDANFVSWGAVASRGEGLDLTRMLRVSSFPFCAVLALPVEKAIVVLQQVEGTVSPEALVEILQRTLEEQGAAFRLSIVEEEEMIRANRELREEQDKSYLAALQKDKEKEEFLSASKSSRKSNDEKLPRKPVQKHSPLILKEDSKKTARPKEASKETQKENTTLRKRHPYTRILIRFPNGTKKEQKFLSTDTIRSIYKYIDSLDIPGVGSYQLIWNFPRKVYGHEQLDMTLGEAGLHPNAALFMELIS
ncbi:plant UBX domain-containing protein 10-like [Phalaenopsis equestris]|uniref:plant UBX domain-containing protein 10-like n=1 Tax=Phalaenopsis equestris TaxID=78828 RepID=UPI0009E41AD8|nr:plant UBX domain-containing protein 10-like [Phalaenopsis equestris]